MKKTRGRPRDEAERKDVDLGIPLTLDQKESISRAARAHGQNMAAWARPILLRAAQEELETSSRE